MKYLPQLRPSPAMVVAFVALLVAMGGTGYAASQLANNSVGTKQLKNNAVTAKKIKNGAVNAKKIKNGAVNSKKVKNGSLLRADFKAGEVPAGPQGPQGPQGPAGPAGPAGAAGAPGSALAYAHVTSTGAVTAARSKNVTAANVTHPATGKYCFSNLSFTPQNAVASPSFVLPKMRTLAVLIGQISSCPVGTQVSVTSVLPGGTAAASDTDSNSDFMIVFN